MAGAICDTRSDLMRAMESEGGRGASVLEAGTRDLVVAYPDELLRDAAARMLARDIGRLPIVDRSDRRKLVGYLGRAGTCGRGCGSTRRRTCASGGGSRAEPPHY